MRLDQCCEDAALMCLCDEQAQERQDAQSKVLQASGLAPAQALAPTVASVADAVQVSTGTVVLECLKI